MRQVRSRVTPRVTASPQSGAPSGEASAVGVLTLYDDAYNVDILSGGANSHRVVWDDATIENHGSGVTVASGYNLVMPSAGAYTFSWAVGLFSSTEDLESRIELPDADSSVERVSLRPVAVVNYSAGTITVWMEAGDVAALFTHNRGGVTDDWTIFEPTLVVTGPL